MLKKLSEHPGVEVLEAGQQNRLGIISFYSLHRHHNLIVRLLNDRFGIQTRGGCSCAGTYGHILLHVKRELSQHITEKINAGDLSEKPGWVRISLHPTLSEEEVQHHRRGRARGAGQLRALAGGLHSRPAHGRIPPPQLEEQVPDLRRDFRPW